MHWIATNLQRKDFAKNIFSNKQLNDRQLELEGHCLTLRMLLIVILNNSSFSHTRLRNTGNDFCTLFDLVSELDRLYRPEKIIQTLETSFLFHKYDWINLVSLKGKRIFEENSFKDEISYFKNKGPLNEDDLKKIKIDITAGGYVFLKHTLIHFEFYSAFAGNKMPLFSTGFRKNKKGEYLFMEILRRTYNMVEYHCILMNSFFERLEMTPKEFKESNLAFKHLGEHHAPKAPHGQFHGCRLPNSTVNYIDCFRLLIINSRNTKGPINPEDRIHINKLLIEWIDKFSALHDKCKDPECEIFRSKHASAINCIIDNKHNDFKTVVVHQKPPAQKEQSRH